MRAATMMQSQWKADTQTGQTLHFENSKGGYFSDREEYGLRLTGKTFQAAYTGKNLLNTQELERLLLSYSKLTTVEIIDGHRCVRFANRLMHDKDFTSAFYREENAGYTLNFRVKSGEDADAAGKDLFVGFMYGTKKVSVRIPLENARDWTNLILTVPASDSDCRIWISYGTTGFWYVDLDATQVEQGASPTAVEPYCGEAPSPSPSYPQPIQCVKAGTVLSCAGETLVTAPCDLYEGDIWWPVTGKVVRSNGVIEAYSGETVPSPYVSATGGLDQGAAVVYRLPEPVTEQYQPQPVSAPAGSITVSQDPVALAGTLTATMLIRR